MNRSEEIPALLKQYTAFVIVSWSGVRPLTTFYDAIKRMNARSKSEVPPVQHFAIGVYGCIDYPTARLVANIADEQGAEFAIVMQGIAERFILGDADVLASQLFKKRIRKKEQIS